MSTSLLCELNDQYKINNEGTVGEMLEEWLGYRLNKIQAKSLHDFIAEETDGKEFFIKNAKILANPLWLYSNDSISKQAQTSFTGLLHGDLHTKNILITKNDSLGHFWLIDFACSREAPLGYDHAYLELSLLLTHLGASGLERLDRILRALQSENLAQAEKEVSYMDLGILKYLFEIRKAQREWQNKNEQYRCDSFYSQQLLARVAAGLNWANKPLGIEEKKTALYYSALSATEYVERFRKEIWKAVLEANHKASEGQKTTDSTETTILNDLWMEVSQFNNFQYKYILLVGDISTTADNSPLALLPWSSIIDLDPLSDQGGLYSQISSDLQKRRSVITFGKNMLQFNPEIGTGWQMAAGWNSHFELPPKNDKEWRYAYLSCIRELSGFLNKNTSLQKIKIIVLPGNALSKVEISLEHIDEALKGRGDFIIICERDLKNSSLAKKHYRLNEQKFIEFIKNIFGTQVKMVAPELPAANGSKEIPLEMLRNLQEEFEILHSRILEESTQYNETDSFWKGYPITWTDLHANLDVQRDINGELTSQLKKLLGSSRNQTLELHHTPGAGGTTAALRAGWILKSEYPVVVLKKFSKFTLDRLDRLFHFIERPILLIADSSLLSRLFRVLCGYKGVEMRI